LLAEFAAGAASLRKTAAFVEPEDAVVGGVVVVVEGAELLDVDGEVVVVLLAVAGSSSRRAFVESEDAVAGVVVVAGEGLLLGVEEVVVDGFAGSSSRRAFVESEDAVAGVVVVAGELLGVEEEEVVDGLVVVLLLLSLDLVLVAEFTGSSSRRASK